MTSRLLPAVVAAVALATLPALGTAQAPGRITVSYRAAPVSDVVSGFASFSHRAIVVAPNVADRLISGDVDDAEWLPALDQLLEAQGLVARTDSAGVLRVEAEQPITLELQDAALSRILGSISAFAGRPITLAPDVGDPAVSFSARSIDWQRALDHLLGDNGLALVPGANGELLVVRRHQDHTEAPRK